MKYAGVDLDKLNNSNYFVVLMWLGLMDNLKIGRHAWAAGVSEEPQVIEARLKRVNP